MFSVSAHPPVAVSEGALLIERIARGDEAALGQLYDAFSAAVFGVAVRILGDRSLAEDATQETFMCVWRNAAAYRPAISNARTWIVLIARRRSIDFLRRRSSRPVEIGLDDLTRPGGTDVWTEVVQRLDREAMAALMNRLPAAQRRAIDLAYVRGLTHVEIARETSAPLGTVKSRVRLALVSIRRMAMESAAAFGAADPARGIGAPSGQSSPARFSQALSTSKPEPRSTRQPTAKPSTIVMRLASL